MKRGLVLAAAVWLNHLAFSSISLRRSQKRLNVKPWIGREDTARTGNKAITREIRDLGRRGRFQEAKEKFMQTDTKDAILYSAIINAAGLKNFQEALDFFEDMKSSDVELSDTVYSAMLKLLGERGDYESAKRTWEEMHDLNLAAAGSPRQQSCFTGLINAAAVTGDVKRVEQEMAAKPHGVELNAAHFGCWLKACREAADPQAAKKVVQAMREADIERNVVHYTMFMGACARYAAQRHSQVAELEQMVLSHMQSDQVEANEYFLEEQVALNLEVASLRDLQREGAKRPSEEALRRTAQVLKDSPLRRTRALRDLRAKYAALGDA